ncbi:Short-chain dehydrogenase [Pedobacter steynii]|uniref:Short-chain dehydrogenase n=1 Tax=Pedobacter steynii TaxID=430522 RepID=A0A1G9MRW6_9SPHI|nr:SDR family oxidoreductase [Pedobacter steynii]NQX39519.1 SDR family oxidoreductase [Pedobacter steynii]SDL76834.1 Short-chain dehydrogenase [Pedobacter steynii]
MDFKNKVVVITGASSGIGKACAEEFAKRGAHLVLAARQYVTLCEITADLETRYDIRAVAVQVDVSKEHDCEVLIKQALVTFDKIDILVNNAGLSMRALFNDLDLSVLKNLMDVNFWGTVYCTKYALPEILKTKGSIIGVSSIAGYRGLPGRTGYSASKFAMNGFMEALRTELLKTGVHVMVACPGFTASNIRVTALAKDGSSHGETSMEEGKMMTADEVAGRIVDGIAGRKRTLVMTGQGKLTVWINKLLPALADKLVFNHFTKEKNALIK